METAGCFRDTLAAITWDRIATFLPNLYQEMFPPINPPTDQNARPHPSDQKSFKAQEPAKEVPTSVSPILPVPDPKVSIPTQIAVTNISNSGSVPDMSNMSNQRGFSANPATGNSTFIEMEEGLRGAYNPLPGAPPLGNYQPITSYPGTIEPYVTMPTNSVTNAIVSDQSEAASGQTVSSGQLSAYPWPSPSGHHL